MALPVSTFGIGPIIRVACFAPGLWTRSVTCERLHRRRHGGGVMAEMCFEGFRTEWAPTVADLLIDPAVSFALKDVLKTWEVRRSPERARSQPRAW